jgi:hypothetical protein
VTLSLHEADRTLPARNGTTAGLIRSGRLAAIPWGKRRRVLRADIERVAAEGFTPELRRPRAPRRHPPAAGVGESILAIDLDALRDGGAP